MKQMTPKQLGSLAIAATRVTEVVLNAEHAKMVPLTEVQKRGLWKACATLKTGTGFTIVTTVDPDDLTVQTAIVPDADLLRAVDEGPWRVDVVLYSWWQYSVGQRTTAEMLGNENTAGYKQRAEHMARFTTVTQGAASDLHKAMVEYTRVLVDALPPVDEPSNTDVEVDEEDFYEWNEEVSLPQKRDDFRHVILRVRIGVDGEDEEEIQVLWDHPDTEQMISKGERQFIEEEVLPTLERSWVSFNENVRTLRARVQTWLEGTNEPEVATAIDAPLGWRMCEIVTYARKAVAERAGKDNYDVCSDVCERFNLWEGSAPTTMPDWVRWIVQGLMNE